MENQKKKEKILGAQIFKKNYSEGFWWESHTGKCMVL